MDEATFMDDLEKAFEDRAQVILNRVDAHDWDVLVGVIESTDRVQHMMWRLIDPTHPMYDAALAARFGDSIERVYRRADEFVGRGGRAARPRHGGSDRLGSRISLVAKGGEPEYLAGPGGIHDARRPAARRKEARRSFRRRRVLGERRLGAHTRLRHGASDRSTSICAGARGMASSVPAPKRHSSTTNWPRACSTLRDPDDGTPIVRAVYRRDESIAGEYLDNAAELQVGMRGRLPRIVADDSRGSAAGRRLSEHEEVERRSRRLRLRDDARRAHFQPSDDAAGRPRSWTSRRPF